MTLSMTSWTIVFDTIYALQDVKDDAEVGIGSTALLFGTYLKPILGIFAVISVAAIAYTGFLSRCGAVFWVVSIGGAMLWHTRALCALKVDDTSACWTAFKV
jgi:4-hydroxybenzoate polyprenyltransferase